MSDEHAATESRSIKWLYAGLATLALAGFGLAYYLNVPYLDRYNASDLREQNVQDFRRDQSDYEESEGSASKSKANLPSPYEGFNFNPSQE